METINESVVCVYDNGELKAIVKRDTKSKKALVFLVKEADVDQISNLISNNQTE